MKKLILSLVFVLAIGVTLMNASSTNDEMSTIENSIKTIEEFGCAGDCVSIAKEGAIWEEGEDADRSAGGALVQAYMRYYETCLELNC